MTEKCLLSKEQKEAREYCLFRPLERPKLKWSKVLGILIGVEILVSSLSYALSLWRGTFLIYYIPGNLLCFISTGKQILIGIVKLYQRYAPEETRRKCLYKPTCSEYALSVKGLYKIYIRLFKTCRGIEYGIDYP